MSIKRTKAKSKEVRRRAGEVHRQLKSRPAIEDVIDESELNDAAPFYFELRGFVKELRDARIRADMTLAEIEKKSGLAIESLSRLETGSLTNPTWKTLGAYALAVGCRLKSSID